jgi:nucleoside 2-deoxyribosyltransferase
VTFRGDTHIAVAGGSYYEKCLKPNWNEVYGSGGRAACALSQMGSPTELHTYVDFTTNEQIESLATLYGFETSLSASPSIPKFVYSHGLESPRIYDVPPSQAVLSIKARLAVRFGMLEGDAIVTADRAVYDPQSASSPRHFRENGSTARELALILNKVEAVALAGGFKGSYAQLAKELHHQGCADVLVIKLGARGVLIFDGQSIDEIPAYQTDAVWKIGSGDIFTAHFAHNWLQAQKSAAESAELASKATAYYCNTQGFASPETLPLLNARAVTPSKKLLEGSRPLIYLAGPFFTLADLWLVNEARNALMDMGLSVFSPYHSVGHGSAADVVHKDLKAIDDCVAALAVCDGMDPGTVYEVGYARARGKPVVVYSENETSEHKKMMEGSGCILKDDFVTALYTLLWEAIAA